MKKFMFAMVSLFYSVSFSQTSSSILALPVEIYPMAKSTSLPNGSTDFKMEAASQVWAAPKNTNTYAQLYTWLSDDYNTMAYTVANDNNYVAGWH